MKLIEKKSKVPASFITSYVSEAWEQIGRLKSDIEAISKEYTNAKTIIECLQDIQDAYIIAAGRLQNYLADTDEIESLDQIEEKVETKTEVKEEFIRAPKLQAPKQQDNLNEDVIINNLTINKIDTISPAELIEIDEFPSPDLTDRDIADFNKALETVSPIQKPVEHEIKPYTPTHYNPQSSVEALNYDQGDSLVFDEMPEADSYDQAELAAMMDMLNKNRG